MGIGTKVLAAVVVWASVAIPGTAASSVPIVPTVPELGRTNLVTAGKTAFIHVRIPVAVRPDVTPSVDDPWPVWVYGKGRVMAFVLVPERGPAEPVMFGWRFGRCNERACTPSSDFGSTIYRARPEIAAGVYRLYVVSDGAPVHVRLRFPELEGRTSLRARSAVHAQIESLVPQVDPAPDNVFWDGAEAEDSGRGFSLLGLYVDAPEDGRALGARGLCVYDENEPPREDVAYAPPCPGAYNPVDPMAGVWNEQAYYNPEEIVPAMGAWFANAAALRDAGGFALWLPY